MEQKDIKNMFDEISSNYDKLNNIISFGMHYCIKSSSVKLFKLAKNTKGLDLCTGTGDFIKIIRNIYPSCDVTGVDSSEKMLDIARIKNPSEKFINADCTQLPFESSVFDFVTMGFGLRNIIDRESALKEINRVLKSGGLFLHLDFGNKNLLSRMFDVITPVLSIVFGGRTSNYQYLINSKKNYPEPEELINLFEKFCFKLVKRKDFLFGAISVQIMQKI